MPKNEIVSICIPTYNRPAFIEYQLNELIPILSPYQIEIIISDNSDNLETAKVVSRYASNYAFIQYHKNETNISDANFLKAISYPASYYRWIISDSTIIRDSCFKKTYTILNDKKYDFVLLNSDNRSEITEDREYIDQNKLLSDLGWHLTFLSAFIYSKNVIPLIDNIKRYSGSNFLHHALLFENIPYSNLPVFWIGDNIYNTVQLKKANSWTDVTFDLWNRRWMNYILSLPDRYTLQAKLKCIYDHGAKTSVFNIKHICDYYFQNSYNRHVYREYKSYFKYTQKHKFFLRFILVIPRKILYPVYKCVIIFNKSKRKILRMTGHLIHK